MTPFYTIRFPAALALAYGLSGCVGGSDTYAAAVTTATATSGAAATTTAALRSAKYDEDGFDTLAGEATAVIRRFDMWKPAEAASVPLSGAATYNGIAAFGDNASLTQINAGDPDALASMALNVNFGTARVTGSIWGFRGKDGKVGDGSIALKGLQDSTSVKASGSSTIYWGDVDQDVTVNIDGFFLANEKAIKGTMANTLEGPRGQDIQQGGVIILNRDTE
ncbi:hypothetical protein ACEN2J_09080 [Pseudorhodobacter sp. W20_MBD10_FR17]|uniref:hypothetical protein n=1 Tax=Pseudorhodobacter sp. W20_MBD10_FR17 TaxID=3240266 RepID=UPI003F96D31F